MAASEATIEQVLEVIQRHVSGDALVRLLTDLRGIPGSSSFRETVDKLYCRALDLPRVETTPAVTLGRRLVFCGAVLAGTLPAVKISPEDQRIMFSVVDEGFARDHDAAARELADRLSEVVDKYRVGEATVADIVEASKLSLPQIRFVELEIRRGADGSVFYVAQLDQLDDLPKIGGWQGEPRMSSAAVVGSRSSTD